MVTYTVYITLSSIFRISFSSANRLFSCSRIRKLIYQVIFACPAKASFPCHRYFETHREIVGREPLYFSETLLLVTFFSRISYEVFILNSRSYVFLDRVHSIC